MNLNWLLWLPGWALGWAFWNGFIAPKDNSNEMFLFKFITWTMIWVWVCWKFIS